MGLESLECEALEAEQNTLSVPGPRAGTLPCLQSDVSWGGCSYCRLSILVASLEEIGTKEYTRRWPGGGGGYRMD